MHSVFRPFLITLPNRLALASAFRISFIQFAFGFCFFCPIPKLLLRFVTLKTYSFCLFVFAILSLNCFMLFVLLGFSLSPSFVVVLTTLFLLQVLHSFGIYCLLLEPDRVLPFLWFFSFELSQVSVDPLLEFLPFIWVSLSEFSLWFGISLSGYNLSQEYSFCKPQCCTK